MGNIEQPTTTSQADPTTHHAHAGRYRKQGDQEREVGIGLVRANIRLKSRWTRGSENKEVSFDTKNQFPSGPSMEFIQCGRKQPEVERLYPTHQDPGGAVGEGRQKQEDQQSIMSGETSAFRPRRPKKPW